MSKKYYINDSGRIVSLKDFNDVKKDDIGGFVRSEKNLSHHNNCWVYGDAQVGGYAQVCGDAKVYDKALVCGNALVYDNAQVGGDAKVYGDAKVGGNALVV